MDIVLVIGIVMIFMLGGFLGTGIVALVMAEMISRANEIGGTTNTFQDFASGDIEIIQEKDYTLYM